MRPICSASMDADCMFSPALDRVLAAGDPNPTLGVHGGSGVGSSGGPCLVALRQVVGTWPICFPVGAPDFGHVLMDAAGGMAPRLDVWTSAFSRALVRAAVVALCARVWHHWRGRQMVRMRAPLVLRAWVPSAGCSSCMPMTVRVQITLLVCMAVVAAETATWAVAWAAAGWRCQ